MLQFMSGHVWKSLERILCFNMYAFFFVRLIMQLNARILKIILLETRLCATEISNKPGKTLLQQNEKGKWTISWSLTAFTKTQYKNKIENRIC